MVLPAQRSRDEHAPRPPARSGPHPALVVLGVTLAAVVAIVAVIVALSVLVVVGRGSDEHLTAVAVAEPADAVVPAPSIPAVWPDPSSGVRLGSPEEAVRSFATELAGFDQPVVGPFTDELDGAVELRPTPDGPLTMVQVRQDGDLGAWYVVAAGSSAIAVARPGVGEVVGDELALVGSIPAGTGLLEISVNAIGSSEPLASVTMAGSSDGATLPFDDRLGLPGGPSGPGYVLVTATTADRVVAATIIPVMLD